MPTSQEKYLYTFIHNSFGHFFKDTLDFFTDHLNPRFAYNVVSTYDKAVEYIRRQGELGREQDKPNLPSIILNPVGEFMPAESRTGAIQLWRWPNLASGFIKRIINPIYQDSHVIITPGFTRLKGNIELIMLTNSFYEFTDLKMLMLLIFGGMERYIYPQTFSSYIILPEELLNYHYTNDVTGESYYLDWDSAGAHDVLVKTIAQDKTVVDAFIKPIYRLMSLSDGSTKYGGEKLADWRLLATLEYEVEIPSWMILEQDYLVQNIKLEIGYESAYSKFSALPPVNRTIRRIEWDFGLNEYSDSPLPDPTDTTSNIVFVCNATLIDRRYHIISASEAASTTDIEIDLPYQVVDPICIIVNSKHGRMNYWDHYKFINNGRTMQIIVENVDLEEGMIIELYLYKCPGICDVTLTSTTTSTSTSISTTSSTTT